MTSGHVLTAERVRVNGIAFAPDGNQLATASDDGVDLWVPRDGDDPERFDAHRGVSFSVAFHPHNSTFASGGQLGTVTVWKLGEDETKDGNQKVLVVDQQLTYPSSSNPAEDLGIDGGLGLDPAVAGPNVMSVAFRTDGRLLAAAGDDGTIVLWDVEKKRLVRVIAAHGDRINSVAFSLDGEQLASGGDDGYVRIWNVATGEPEAAFEHEGVVLSVAFSPDGELVAAGDAKRLVKLWKVADGTVGKKLKGHADWVRAVAFSPAGSELVSAGMLGAVMLWNIATGGGAQRRQLKIGDGAAVLGVAFSPDGKRIATSAWNGTVEILDIESKQALHSFNVGARVLTEADKKKKKEKEEKRKKKKEDEKKRAAGEPIE